MILVKLLLPLETSNTQRKALLYSEDGRFAYICPSTEQMIKRMGRRQKAFFHIDLTQGEPILLDEVPDPGWE
jgi:hypothetical protein